MRMNMAEENEESLDQAQSQENEGQEQQEQTLVEEQSQPEAVGITAEERASQVDHIMNMAEKDPSIKELPEYQAMLKEIEAGNAESKTQGEEKGEEKEKGNEEEESSEGESKGEESTEEEEEDDIASELSEEDDVFGLNKGKKKTKYKFENEKDVVKLIQKKGFKEVPTFFESVDKWRNDSQELVQVQERATNLEEGLSSLPTPIKDAIVAYSNSQDWRTAFSESSTSIDFNTDFEELNKEEVVKYYFKDKYDKLKGKHDEDYYDDEEYEDRINDFYESSERLFKSDKTALEKRRAEIIDRQNQEEETLKESALSSVQSLKQEFPNFNASQLQKIRQHLVNGDVNNKLFVNDGKYVEDAAKRVAFALYGDKILKARIEKARTKGKSESKEEFFMRGDKNPKTKNSQQGYSGSKANGAVKHLSGQFQDDPYA